MLQSLYSVLILSPFRWFEWVLGCLRLMSIFTTLSVIVLYKWGVLHRVLHRFIEAELGKLCNGATVTIASVEVIFFTTLSSSTIVIHDAILHTPQRNEWQWDSPLIARMGRTQVTLNLWSILVLPDFVIHWADKFCHIQGLESTTPKRNMMHLSATALKTFPNIFSFLLLFRNIPLRDIYTIQMEDVQVFVEKRRNVFNFHLLDDSLEIPDPKKVMESFHPVGSTSSLNSSPTAMVTKASTTATTTTATAAQQGHMMDSRISPNAISGKMSPVALFQNTNLLASTGSFESSPGKKSLDDPSTTASTQTASEILNHMLGAVSNISKAVNEGKGISTALKHQKDGFVSHLKHFLTVPDPSTTSGATSPTTHSSLTHPSFIKSDSCDSTATTGNSQHILSTKSMGVIAKEGIQVIKQVGRAMEQNVLDMKQVVDNLSKPPPKKAGSDVINYDLFRIGRITFREVRVFTKDVFSIRSSTFSSTLNNNNNIKVLSSTSNAKQESMQQQQQRMDTTGWSKPVLLKEVILTSMDLCPPSKNLDEDGTHAMGQRIDVLADIVLKRLLAEMAKTNTGLLLNNALGEVFAVLDSKRIMGGSNSTTTAKA